MKVTEQDVQYVADLSNLELTPAEKTRMQKDLNDILAYVDSLAELDTTNVAPLAEIASKFAPTAESSAQSQGSGRFTYATRPDVVVPGLTHEAAMENAPDTDGKFFKVPKVIEK
jgi:aspartyl-tRNA(Asn)/glutamyl-tRNA(Gln) amidotransferase subunit C